MNVKNHIPDELFEGSFLRAGFGYFGWDSPQAPGSGTEIGIARVRDGAMSPDMRRQQILWRGITDRLSFSPCTKPPIDVE